MNARLHPATFEAAMQILTPAAASFAPTDSAGLTLFLRPSVTSYVTGSTPASDTEKLSSWADSVSGKSFAQATAASKPLYLILEQFSAVRFSGANRTNALAYTNKIFGGTTDFLLSVAVRLAQRNTASSTIYSETNSADAVTFLTISTSGAGLVRCNLRDGVNAVVSVDSTTRIDDNKIHIVSLSVIGTAVKVYVDGVQEGTGSIATLTSWGAATFNRSTLCARTGSSVNQWAQADLFEVVGYAPALSAGVLASHHTYLISKFAAAIPSIEVCGSGWGADLYGSAIYRASNNRTYIGSTNWGVNSQVTVIDHAANPVTKLTYEIDTANPTWTDRHNNVAINFAKTGKLMAVYDNHNSNVMNFKLSTSALDPSAWGSSTDIGPGTKHAYPHMIATTEGAASWRVWTYYREEDTGSWNYRITDNDGTAYGTATALWQPQGAISLQVYGKPVRCADGKIHFAMQTDDVTAAGGVPDLYHFIYDPAQAKYYKSDGTTEITSLPFDTTDATLVYDSSAHGNRNAQFTGDICTNGGNIYITHMTKQTEDSTNKRLVRWTYSAGAWTLDEILTPTIAPGCCFGITGSIVDPDKIYFIQTDGNGDRQLYQTVRSGGVWTTSACTSGQHLNNSTSGPIRIRDAEQGGACHVTWFWGNYTDADTPYGQVEAYPAP